MKTMLVFVKSNWWINGNLLNNFMLIFLHSLKWKYVNFKIRKTEEQSNNK